MKTFEERFREDERADYMTAIGIARLNLIQGDAQAALDALDNPVDSVHRKHYDALIADGYSAESIEHFLGPLDRATPRKRFGEGV